MKKLDQLLNYINSINIDRGGIEFMNSIIQYFGDIIKKDYVIVSHIRSEDLKLATAIAIYSNGEFLQKFTYRISGVQGTIISDKKINFCTGRDQNCLPDYDLLIPCERGSYIGIPLITVDGRVFGLIEVIDNKLITESERKRITIMLKVISVQMALVPETILKTKKRKRSSLILPGDPNITNMILDILPGLFFIYDISEGIKNAYLVNLNRKWYCEKLGYGPDEMPPSYPEFFFSLNENEKVMDALQELVLANYIEVELNTKHKSGYEIPYLFIFNIFSSENRTYFIGFGFDASERKYAESALKQSELYFKNIFNSSSDGILVLDLEYKILNANDAILKMFDYKYEEIIFRNILDFLPVAVYPLLESRRVLMLKNSTTAPIELEVRKRNGEAIPVEINSILINDGETILTTARDITERKLQEKRISNSEIYAEEKERERFAKELHDGLGPLLSTCKIYIHTLNEMLEGQDELLEVSCRALSLLDDALGSLKEISNNLSPHVLRNFGLIKAILSFINKLESLSSLKFEVHFNYDKKLDEVIEFTVYRIITELINNTIKYGEATLVTISIFLDNHHLKVNYKDDGKGFDLEEVKKRNRGFGLVNMESRINKFNGSFFYSTSPGNGVSVEFNLDSNNF
jgi:PAS domain S-box-containing protein